MERKIRVWDKEDKRMITDTQEFIPLIVTNKGILRLNAEHKGNLYTLIPFGDRFISMEETGLKDKNGKEIYEGDIIENPVGHRGKIVFKRGSFIADFGLNDYLLWDGIECKRLIVIDNIYKNPNLL